MIRLSPLMVNVGALVGVWMDAAGVVHTARREAGKEAVFHADPEFRPFAWARREAMADEAASSRLLSGQGKWNHLWEFPSRGDLETALKREGRDLDALRPWEQQWLLRRGERLFAGLTFPELRRVQLDIEVSSSEAGTFPDANRPEDRILAIGLRSSTEGAPRLLEIEEESSAGERALLERFGEVFRELDPDVVEGHNIHHFDLDYLQKRCRRHRVARNWGRFGAAATFRKSRLRVAERWLDYMRCDLPGRAVFDTLLALQLFDVTTRDLPSYTLKAAARYFGITREEDERTYLPGEAIADVFRTDRRQFRAYLRDDLRETAGLAERLLPTYVAQVQHFPMLLPEALLRGTGSKVDLLLLERYFAADQALPEGTRVESFEGGLTKSFGAGVFEKVLHFDVASLYPSLLLQIGRNPANDDLGAFLPLLETLRTERLRFKELARSSEDAEVRQEYQARQASFKVLINSFYGYLGFSGARFADGELAAAVTRRGRELLQGLMDWFEAKGLRVLEADTDGLYVAAPDFFDEPEALLEAAQSRLPAGIDLEFDGRYERMFCYKAKNYALLDGERILIRGSALRSRGTEPFLKELTDHLIAYLLGVESFSPEVLLNRLAEEIEAGTMPIQRLLKSEYLSMAPATYAEKMATGGKPRRAALEVALTLDPPPRVGERVRYYLARKEKGQTADWQRAVAAEHLDPEARPYDPKAYLKRLREWERRYRMFYE